ncbi:MAG: family 10 glycosylhydrolase [Clostridia bacterium]|nr:family 10 glycosylhydrolase [Clostridia bacterium]
MKKIFVLFIIFLIAFSGCSSEKNENKNVQTNGGDEIRGVWIFYSELSMISESGGNEESFTAKISEMFDNCKRLQINNVFVQIRPFADSFYPSEIFPWSKYLTGEQGRAVDYDPLKIMVEQAHGRSLKIHAWLNPFRISLSSSVCDEHPAKKWIDEKSDNVIITEQGTFFNPASVQANKLILNGVREIAEKYDVDGIHIDDYFYMSQSADIDKNDYQKYTSSGGKLSLDDWRRQNISSFVSSMYSAVKAADENIIVSVSPAGNIHNNYNTLYADVKKWACKKGYCDWLIPQLYYGFESESLPYKKAADEWQKIHKEKSIKLIAGLAAYRAVGSPEGEWQSGDIIARQIDYARSKKYDGYCFFSYSSIVDDEFTENYESAQSFADGVAERAGGER